MARQRLEDDRRSIEHNLRRVTDLEIELEKTRTSLNSVVQEMIYAESQVNDPEIFLLIESSS